jgi:hypothetical protein
MHFYTLLRYHSKSACETLMCLKSSFLFRKYKSFVEGQKDFHIIWSSVFKYTLCRLVLLILMILLSTLLRAELIHLNLTITKAGIMIPTHLPYFWLIINFIIGLRNIHPEPECEVAWRPCNPVPLRNNICITHIENVIRNVAKNFLWPFVGPIFRSENCQIRPYI